MAPESIVEEDDASDWQLQYSSPLWSELAAFQFFWDLQSADLSQTSWPWDPFLMFYSLHLQQPVSFITVVLLMSSPWPLWSPCFIKHTKPRKSSCVSFTWPSAPNGLLILPSNHSFLLYTTIPSLSRSEGFLLLLIIPFIASTLILF